MTAQAKNLSGGQKRKLSVGIAILGDPKVPGVLIYSYYSYFFFSIHPLFVFCVEGLMLVCDCFFPRSCSWTSPRQAWTPAPDTRCGLC